MTFADARSHRGRGLVCGTDRHGRTAAPACLGDEGPEGVQVADDLFDTVPLLVHVVVAGADGVRVGLTASGYDTGGDGHRARVDTLRPEFGAQGVRPVAQAGHEHVGQEGRGDRRGHSGRQQQRAVAPGRHLRQHLARRTRYDTAHPTQAPA
ncbi:hypothetical protein ACIREO_14765 [Streptomyces sp. NPDC102441]|uniref:hypothetical protein n=1 Tax=Streptomyces sp. NPDC102441 TaxID=3366176 RepID=UPI003829B750